MAHSAAITALKEEIQRDLTGFVPPGTLVPRDVHKNLQDTLDIVDGVDERVEALENVVIPPSGTSLDNGGNVRWLQDYDFRVSAAAYSILGVPYTSPQTDVALAVAHATLPRIDVIAVNISGAVVVITGDADENPSKPLVDPSEQLELTFVYVAAGTTQPLSASAVTVYDENLGTPDEWYVYSDHASVVVNSATAQTGSVGIEGTNVPVEPWLVEMSAEADNIIIADNSWSLGFSIKSKGTWGNGNNAKRLIISVLDWNTADVIGTPVLLKARGTYGFDSSITADWQQVTIPLADLGMVPGRKATAFRIGAAGSSGTLGFYIDGIILTGNGVAQSIPSNSSFSVVPVDNQGTAVTNAIQERSDGEVWAVDSAGASTKLSEAPTPSNTRVLSGGEVAWTPTLDNGRYTVAKCKYLIQGFEYNSPETVVSLAAASPTDNRIDVIYARDNGTIGVLQGDYNAGEPVKPFVDTTFRVELCAVEIRAAGGNQPPQPYIENLFNEDLGTGGGEWDFYSYDPSIVVADLGAGNDWNGDGQYAIHFNNTPTGVWMAELWRANPIGYQDNASIILRIKSLGSWGSGKGAKKLVIFPIDYNEGVGICNSIAIGDGAYGFDSSNITDWQTVIIPISDFGIAANTQTAGAFGFTVVGENGSLNAYVDGIDMNAFRRGCPQKDPEFRIVVSEHDQINTLARNSIQQLSDGSIHAVDKYGATIPLTESAGSDEILYTDTISNGAPDASNDGTYTESSVLTFSIPPRTIKKIRMSLGFFGGSTDFQLATKFVLAGASNGDLTEQGRIWLSVHNNNTPPAPGVVLSRAFTWIGTRFTDEIVWDTLTGYENANGHRIDCEMVIRNQSNTDTGTITFAWKVVMGYGSAILTAWEQEGEVRTFGTF